MRIFKFAAFPALLALGALSALSAATVYVRSPAARLLNAANMSAPGTPLKAGEALTLLGEEGLFYRVRTDSATGYVAKLFASNLPPGQKVSFGAGIDRSTSVNARARASNYAQTASARGFSASENLRARGNLHEYDFDALHWLENLPRDEDGSPDGMRP